MKNKILIISLVVIISIVVGGLIFYNTNTNNQSNKDKITDILTDIGGYKVIDVNEKENDVVGKYTSIKMYPISDNPAEIINQFVDGFNVLYTVTPERDYYVVILTDNKGNTCSNGLDNSEVKQLYNQELTIIDYALMIDKIC